jgi:hypothetical protein
VELVVRALCVWVREGDQSLRRCIQQNKGTLHVMHQLLPEPHINNMQDPHTRWWYSDHNSPICMYVLEALILQHNRLEGTCVEAVDSTRLLTLVTLQPSGLYDVGRLLALAPHLVLSLPGAQAQVGSLCAHAARLPLYCKESRLPDGG